MQGIKTGSQQVFVFGEIHVDAGAHRLTRAGVPQPLEPKAFAVLLALLDQPGVVLGKDDLLDQVWGHRHVTPGVLTRVVAQIRQALGDTADAPRYIQTVHTLGYRFIGALAAGSATPEPPTAAVAAPPRRRMGERRKAPIRVTEADREAAKDSYSLGRRHWYERTPASLARALAHFRQAVDSDPEHARAWCGVADSYLLLHEYADLPADDALREARAAITTAFGLQPELADAYASQGLLEIERMHYPLAVSLLEQALRLDPALTHARAWHAMALNLDGRLPEAEREMEAAIQHDPANVVLLTTLSMNLVMQGRWDGAEQLLGSVRLINPGYLETYWQLAWLRVQCGRLAAARHALRVADQYAGDSAWSRLYVAQIALMCDDPDMAERTLAGIAVDPDFNFWQVRVEALWARARWNEAVDYLRTLRPLPADRSHHAALLGHALARVGQRADALACYESAYRGDPVQGDSALRPWDMSLGLGERANLVALLDAGHPRRQPILDGLKGQLRHLRDGGVRLPALDYHAAVLAALAGDVEESLHSLDQALAGGFADAMAFTRELAWGQFPDTGQLAERRQRMAARVASERARLEAAEVALAADSGSPARQENAGVGGP